MAETSFPLNDTVPIRVIFLKNNVPITNADGKLTIQRLSDNNYFTGSGWQAAPTLLSMNEFDEVNSPGRWEFDFVTATFVKDTYIFVVTDSAGEADNAPLGGEAIVGKGLAEATEFAAAGAVGRAEYDPVSSETDLYNWQDNTTIVKTFDNQLANGDPSETDQPNKKLPQ